MYDACDRYATRSLKEVALKLPLYLRASYARLIRDPRAPAAAVGLTRIVTNMI